METLNNYYDIVVLDSGVLETHKSIDNKSLKMLEIKSHKDGLYEIIAGGSDNVGHGTAVISILQNQIKMPIRICSVKILNESNTITGCEIDRLLFALSYIKENISCKIIHMSCGLKYYNQELKDICDAIINKDVIIVAAFNNDGSVSFPAAFENVIGVDASLRCILSDDFVYVENSIVNVKAKGGNQRLAWVNPPYIISQGSSFAAPYVTAYIMNKLNEGVNIREINEELKKYAKYIYKFSNSPAKRKFIKMKNVAIFPYNKEMHNIINFMDLLSFNVINVFDIKQSGRVGKNIEDFYGHQYGKIMNIDNINYDTIDTLIIGHVVELEIYTKKNIKSELLEKCLQNNVNVFSLDDYLINDFSNKFKDKKICIHYPYDVKINYDSNFGKLYKIKSPVVAIMGTSMQQGKFALQLSIKRNLTAYGYKVAHLATEPTGELFGADYVYPFGYAGTAHETGNDSKCILNYMLHKIDIKNPDIILCGSQSGTVPMVFENVANLYTTSIDFLLGIQPDAVILCVNIFDEISYIERSINSIIGICDTKIIALALYPMKYPNNWFYYRNKRQKCEYNEISNFINRIREIINIPIYIMDENGYNGLSNTIINFFSE